ncbi:MAG TPA: c-type cytochrome [Gaiellales bacterium]|nr:c-type cytochrome [Gaiellales bacterium]
MRRVALGALCATVIFGAWAASAASGAGGARSAQADRGAELYAENCSSCHGIAGAGKRAPGPVNGVGDVAGFGPSLRGVGALAADFYLRTGYMPLRSPSVQPRRSKVEFSPDQIRALVAYVASLAPGPAIPTPHPAQGSLSEGMTLFTENCAGCHQAAAAGGYVPDAVAPPLGPDSPRDIAEAVRIGPNLMPRFSPARLTDSQLDSLIAYVRYARSPDDRGGVALSHIGPVPEGLVAWLVAGVVLVGVCIAVARRPA